MRKISKIMKNRKIRENEYLKRNYQIIQKIAKQYMDPASKDYSVLMQAVVNMAEYN